MSISFNSNFTPFSFSLQMPAGLQSPTPDNAGDAQESGNTEHADSSLLLTPETNRVLQELSATVDPTYSTMLIRGSLASITGSAEIYPSSDLLGMFEGTDRLGSYDVVDLDQEPPQVTALLNHSKQNSEFDEFPFDVDFDFPFDQAAAIVQSNKKSKQCNQCGKKDIKKTYKCPLDRISILCKGCFNRVKSLANIVLEKRKR